MIDKFAEAAIKKLRVDMNEYADHLASNGVNKIEDYKYVCGVIRGLAIAEEYIKDLATIAERNDE